MSPPKSSRLAPAQRHDQILDAAIGLLERLGAQREDELRAPVGRSARARVADAVSRWLARRAAALLATFHSDIAGDTRETAPASLRRPR